MQPEGRVMCRFEKQSPLDWHTVSSHSPISRRMKLSRMISVSFVLFPYRYTLVPDEVHVHMSELTSDSLV